MVKLGIFLALLLAIGLTLVSTDAEAHGHHVKHFGQPHFGHPHWGHHHAWGHHHHFGPHRHVFRPVVPWGGVVVAPAPVWAPAGWHWTGGTWVWVGAHWR